MKFSASKKPFALSVLILIHLLFFVFGTQAQPDIKARLPVDFESEVIADTPQKAWLTFGLDRLAPLQWAPFADIPLWQYLSSLIYIFLAFYVSRMLDAFISSRVKKWAARTATTFDDVLVDLLRGPVRIVSFVILLHIGMQVYAWPAVLEDFFSKALKTIVAVSITYVLLKAVDAWVRVWKERTTTPENEQFSRQLLPLISKTLKVFVVIVAVLVTSQNLGLNVTGLIASLSIGGLAMGLAAQDTLANLFGAVAVLVDKPFKVGDRIKLDQVDGTVETIGFRSTCVRNLDGHLVTVPNKTMGNATITNITARPNIKSVMNIGITYDTPPDKVLRAVAILEEVYRSHPMTHDVWISFDKFNDFSLNLLVIYWWKSTVYKDFLAGMQDLNLKIKQRFGAEGIEFAFPTQTVHLQRDSGVPAKGDAAPTAILPSQL
ncbi:MAG TPA: mechanosensitive ion channel family protein [Candidatus Paceibacterota bacterium]|nr:mechanosensitive ion channel family protein [Verrucomicrobiota bacterium]HRY47704.1 mechanosensitive ion channel family protein [Candidatus Paceibacterota bacterium]